MSRSYRESAIPDTLMWDWFLLLTDVSRVDLDRYKQEVDSGKRHPKSLKQKLAHLLTSNFRGTESANRAEAEFETIFASGGLPENIETVELSQPPSLSELLAKTELATSRKEADRLIKQGAVSIDGQKQDSGFFKLTARSTPYVLKVGKRRFLKVMITS